MSDTKLTALRWAMVDLEYIGIDPERRTALTKALTNLYASMIGGDPWGNTSSKSG